MSEYENADMRGGPMNAKHKARPVGDGRGLGPLWRPRCAECGGDIYWVNSFDRDAHWAHTPRMGRS